jgi:hypothetical protein
MSTSFTQVFGGTTIYPSDVSYLALALTGDISLEWPLEATTGNNVVARIIDITPTGAYTITMPDAMSVGVGQTVLFNNLGPNTVTVDNAAGTAILSIGAGEQWQAYLIDNTTIGGVWRTFRYGAAVAQAQAAALAGAGLIADGSELAQNYEVIDFSITPYGLTIPDRAKIFVWTGGLGTLTLPTAVSAGDGWFVQVRNGGQGDLTIDPSGSEFINAASTLRLQPGDSAVVVSDGVQWYTIGLGQQAVFAFDYTTIAVTGGTYTLSGSELNRIAYKFTGTLTSDLNIVVPATVQQYWVNNATTGAFTLALKTASGSPTLVDQNSTAILYCDGTTIVAATTSVTFGGILPVLQGGTGANNGPSALTNLGGTGIGTAVFTASTTAAARTAIAAAASGANSDITSLTGLTTPLSVGQGGTGTSTAFTAGSVAFAGASGVYSQDNANLFWDNTNDRLGIGTASPLVKLDVVGDASFGSTITTGSSVSTGDVKLELGGNRSDVGNVYIDLHALAGQDFNSRIVRYGGTNGGMDIINAGTGGMVLSQEGSAPMVFKTNATESMRILSGGNVGIGTSVPNYKLEANGVIASYVVGVGQAGYWTYNGGATAEWFTGQRSGADHAYKISQVIAGVYTDRVTVDTLGNVGIGTTSPGSRLQIYNSSGNTQARIYTPTGTSASLEFSSDTYNYINAAGGAALGVQVGGTERMRIDTSGNVGIGTSSPSSKLDVNGKVTLTGGEDQQIQWTNNSQTWRLNNSSAGQFYLYDVTGATFPFKVNASAASDSLVITSTGVGIGNTSPTVKLDVTGGIKTSRTAVTAPATSDGNIFSGTYTPTLSNGNLIDVAGSTAYVCQYMRVGDVVTVSGKVDIAVTGTGFTQLNMTLPVPSNFTAAENCAGVAQVSYSGGTINEAAGIRADTTNDRAQIAFWGNVTGAAQSFTFTYTYRVI